MLKLFIMLLLTPLFIPLTQEVNVKQAEKVLKSSVLIRIKNRTLDHGIVKREMSGCSGTFINDNQVLTAAHCFTGAKGELIWIRDTILKVGFPADLLKLDKEHDLALLKVRNVSNHPLTTFAKSVRIGEKVINVGSPLRFEFLISEGIVMAEGFSIKGFKSKYLVTSAMINPGSSGGGAFNDKGELVGVNTMTAGSPFGWAGISLAVSLDDIREFLK